MEERSQASPPEFGGITRSIFERANAILPAVTRTWPGGSLDAIHLAGALHKCASWPLCSNDTRMRAAGDPHGIPAVTAAGREVSLGFPHHPIHGGVC